MVQDNIASHHNLWRKRNNIKHKKNWKKIFDKMMLPIGLMGPMMIIPQIAKIYIDQDASSISAISWIMLIFSASLWLLYGISHKEKVIIISNIARLCAYSFVVIGVVLY